MKPFPLLSSPKGFGGYVFLSSPGPRQRPGEQRGQGPRNVFTLWDLCAMGLALLLLL